ncbi:MAG: TetR/AcrR family transcriptional regulator [Polymorphobacter sp.]|uniref:TetR/AcrR family transcriptional regulator n=1 Tax=Polymorphobacter sp. TaxID=1909290 RepID=UPI003A89D434
MATRAIDTSETEGKGESRARRYDPAETRARVLSAAYMLFSTKGFARTGTADIAREADVSEGSIFYHFGSKQKLLEELGRRHGEMMIAYMHGEDALEDLEPGIIVPRVFEFVRANSMWEGMTGESCEATARTKLMMSAEVEPFYHAAKDTVVEWVQRHMAAAFAKRGIDGIEIDIAASFTHLFVGEAIDRIFATDDAAEQARVERETIRFMRAACRYEV